MKTTYREAIRAALRDAMHRDPRVFLMGEDVGRYGGSYAVSKGLLEEFGPERIRDTPLSESTFVGAGIGAALGGMRPIVEIMTVNFSLLALDQILNNAATLHHMSGGQLSVPLVIRMATGAGRQLAAQHSHSLENIYAHIPGLKVLSPATLEDARGMLWTALLDPDPVILFEHATLYNDEGELADDAGAVPIERAAVRREGKDVTLIAYGASVAKSLRAAATLAEERIEAEVIDLRTLRPLDEATILRSVAKTRRAVVVDEGWKTGSLAAEVSARIMEGGFYDLDAPVARVCTEEVPIPYAKHLEDAALPQPPKIVAAVKAMVTRVLEIKMPSLGADMDAGTLVEWHVQPGTVVKRGDIVALVETQKGIVEIESWEAGTVSSLLVRPGDKVPVGTVLATLDDGGQVPSTRVMASPAARQLAREMSVDLAGIHGTGPHGSVTRDDVEHARPEKTTEPKKAEPSGMRDAIAAAMARSKREIPHYYLAEDIDVTPALTWLASTNASRPPADRLLLAALLVKATALAAREVPEMNGWFKDGAFVPSPGIHVGVAISLRRGGLVAPAILDAAEKSLDELMRALRDLANRVRAGSLRSSELSEPTITVTNLGEQGVASVFGVIYPPQVAIVGFGKVVPRPWAQGGMLGVRSIVSATVSADHRASDGHRGARFLVTIGRLLGEPEKL